MDLVCPKCQGTMRTYERNGVHVDQCADCRGIFLDRGELERLIDGENAWHGGSAARPTRQQEHEQAPASGLGAVVSEVLGRGGSSHAGSGYGHGSGQQRKKKESFLSDLFG
jgi:Zn-finger nucleic acid-binding protein